MYIELVQNRQDVIKKYQYTYIMIVFFKKQYDVAQKNAV